MTIVEFFSETSIENIASALLCAPDQVIFVGDNSKRMQKEIALYEEVVRGRGLNVTFSYKVASRNNLNRIVQVLSDIVEENGKCILDLDGGEDLFLVAVGIVSERYGEKLKLHRFNIYSNSLLDCDADGSVLQTAPKQISIAENIRIYGGRIIFSKEKGEATKNWDFSKAFIEDIKAMWEICRKNPALWNTQVNTLDHIDGVLHTENPLDVVIDKETLSKPGNKLIPESGILEALQEKGLLENLEIKEEYIAFSYKNEQIRRCLTKAGQVLELYITVLAKQVKEDKDTPVYHDVMTGVYIDWDGYLKEENADVSNEIDVLLMKGLVPVFISCKNGSVKVDELYKLSTVAERFGGKYAKKVLAASALDRMGSTAEFIRARAADMNIRIIENLDKMSEESLCRTIKSLWCN